MKLCDGPDCISDINLPLPIRDRKTLLKIIEVELSARPPAAPVKALFLSVETGRPRMVQAGLFRPLSPEPEKLELVMARIAKIVGRENIGCPETLDSFRPDAFRLKHFQPEHALRKDRIKMSVQVYDTIAGFRAIRPPLAAMVRLWEKRPALIHAFGTKVRHDIAGRVIALAGPWRRSGDWWTNGSWARDEWDAELSNGILCRIYRDLSSNLWFIDGIYD